jgi:hypothetical protein
VIQLPPDGLQRLADGERIPFEESYVRTTPRFETSDELSKDHIDYRMYRVL